MKSEMETLEAEILDSIQPFSGLPVKGGSIADQVILSGGAMQQVKTAYTTAVMVQQPRSIAKIANNVLEEARLAGKSFYYRWTVKNKDNTTSVVQGPSIDMAMALCRYYGNCAIEVEAQETQSHYMMKGIFVDLESGFTCPRLFRQRKSQRMGGKMDFERQEDIVFQIGQSKAIRNAVVKAMPEWLIDRAIEIATEAELNKTKKENIHLARQKVIEFIGQYGVSADRIEAERNRPIDQWTPNDIVDLRGMATALKEGRISPEELFPPIKAPEKIKEQPQPLETELRPPVPASSKSPSPEATPPPSAPVPQSTDSQQSVTPVTLNQLVTEVTAPASEPSISPDNPQAGDTTWNGFRDRFINLRGAGYSTFVFKNMENFKNCPKEISMQGIEKWVKLYPGRPWPINAETENRLENGSVTPPQAEASNGVAGSSVPSSDNSNLSPSAETSVSYTPEYKTLMELRKEFPDYYMQAKNELKISPDTVIKCINLTAMINKLIDQAIEAASNSQPINEDEFEKF